MTLAEYDWNRVREIIARSVRGSEVSESERVLIQRAHASDKKRYSRLHQEVKAEAIEEMRSFGRKA